MTYLKWVFGQVILSICIYSLIRAFQGVVPASEFFYPLCWGIVAWMVLGIASAVLTFCLAEEDNRLR